MPARRHLAMLIPMGVSGIVGTFCVVSVNAWMNNPAGFEIVDGQVTNINPWRAMFNGGVWLQFAHMWSGPSWSSGSWSPVCMRLVCSGAGLTGFTGSDSPFRSCSLRWPPSRSR
jgi:hypothetical protein